MRQSRQYDRLNRLQQISTVGVTNGATVVVSGSGYTYNDANQRTRNTQADGAYWSFQYDNLGQVTAGKKYWSDGTPMAGQQFEYAFDEIGNRTSTKAGGNEIGTGLRTASYTPNLLNQYSSRQVPGAEDLLGVARGNVSVNSSTNGVYRRGEYFRKELSLDNTNALVWQSITVTATDGVSSNETGNVFLPRTPEAFTYDNAGNLRSDGRWNYYWDAENRLIRMSTITGMPLAAERRLVFDYDWQGRRITKQVFDRATGGTCVLHDKFLYDGWNLLALLNGTNNALVRSFLWGSDLSGSMQSAGGVGGLIAVTDTANGSHFMSYDGNGNVTLLVSASTGLSSAEYEYGPFGELIRATGTMATANPFRFSTKFQDNETGLIYYGYRYLGDGRWLSRDPIGERGGLNLHAFVRNAPLTLYDALGLIDECCIRLGEAELRKTQKSVWIGFVDDLPTGSAARWGEKFSDVSVRLEKGNTLDDIKRELEKKLGKDDCIETITFSGHGGSQVGIEPAITAGGVSRSTSKERELLEYLRGRMCKSKCCVNLNACDVAKSEEGKKMMQEIARMLDAEVRAYDDWYALVGWGNEYTAYPDGTIEKSVIHLPPYPFKDESHGGKRDYKTWKRQATIPKIPAKP